MSEPKKINSLERFRKRSPQLLLEHYGGCEVPAGCGGAILRWRNPRAARPVFFHVYTSGQLTAFLDGQPLTGGRLDIAPGEHLLALQLDDADRSALLRAAIGHDPSSTNHQVPPGVREDAFLVLSAADGTWRATFAAPGAGWELTTFDDGAWAGLVGCTIPEVSYDQPGGYQWHACQRYNAGGLCAPAAHAGRGPAWVRKRFTVPVPC